MLIECMASLQPPPPTTASSAAASISIIPEDIIRLLILPRLDGPTLASTSCVSAQLHSLSSLPELWANLCHSTWPSTRTSPVNYTISTFSSNGHRSFLSQSFPPHISDMDRPPSPRKLTHKLPSELIYAVDVFYKDDLVFSKVVETETASSWFLHSPFRVDLFHPKETCPTRFGPEMVEEMTLSWIAINPASQRAVNLSSHRPVSVHRHWLSGEVQVRYTIVMAWGKGELVQCSVVVVVTCRGEDGEGMHVIREVSLQVEDMDGKLLNGKESLGILNRALEGRKGISHGVRRREEEAKKRYEMFLERKRERRERKLRTEGTLDMLCVGFGVLVSLSVAFFLLLKITTYIQ